MSWKKEDKENGVFIGAPIPRQLAEEYTRLCAIAGRSKASDLTIAIEERVGVLLKQEQKGTIRGTSKRMG